MARTVHLRLSSEAETFLKDMENTLGFNEEQVFAKAVALLHTAYHTNRVALIREDFKQKEVEAVEHYFTVRTPQSTNGSSQKS